MQEATFVSSLGKYRLIASLARGGMARVYLAVMAGPASFHKLLVLKVMRGGALGDSDDAVRMFMNEARLAARVVHANVVHTYEVGEIDGRPFLAMEYVEGQTYRTLQARAAAEGLPLHEELRILAELARGLHCVHELANYDGEPLCAVHRDVSPQNVLIGYDGQVKLLDFGIAKTADASHWTQAGVIKGKIDYIAPEQLRGEAVDRRADVFSLGVMLWEAVAGQRFAGGATSSEVAKAQARLSGSEPKIRDVKRDVPEPLAALLDRALAVDPTQRLPDAVSFADALDSYLETSGQRPSARSLSLRMLALFAEDRDRLRKLVEEQIESIKRTGHEAVHSEATGILPRVELRGTRTSSTLWALAPHASAADALHAARATSDRPVKPARGKLRPRSWAVMVIACATAAAAAWFTPSDEPPRAELRTASPLDSRPGAASLVGTSPDVRDSVSERPLAAASSHERSSAPEAARDTVAVSLSVAPSSARVTLDGVAIALPFSGELPRDGTLHELRASAPGYLPLRQLLGLDRDRTLELVLQRAPARRAAASSARPATSPAGAKAPGPRPLPILLPIDTDDPYKPGAR